MAVAHRDEFNVRGWVILAGLLVLGGLLVATLTPMPFHRIPPNVPFRQGYRYIGAMAISLSDLGSNILLFIPVGGAIWSMWVALTGRIRFAMPAAVMLAALLSTAIEWTQVFIPGRYPSYVDICMNSLGGLIGASVIAIGYGVLHSLALQWARKMVAESESAASDSTRQAA